MGMLYPVYQNCKIKYKITIVNNLSSNIEYNMQSITEMDGEVMGYSFDTIVFWSDKILNRNFYLTIFDKRVNFYFLEKNGKYFLEMDDEYLTKIEGFNTNDIRIIVG